MTTDPTRRVDFARSEGGAATVFSLFVIIMLLMIGGISVDYASGERIRSQLQGAADAAAATAVTRISSPQLAREHAIAVAALNAPVAIHGNVLLASDVVFGHWAMSPGVFRAGETPLNAVRVTTRRAAANGNPLRSFLLRFVGYATLDVSAEAVMVALASGLRHCSGGGLLSRTMIKTSSNNTYRNDFCLYGRSGVEIGSDTVFERGTRIEMPRLSDFKQSGNNIGVAEALRQATQPVDLPDRVAGIISAMRSGNIATSGMPSYIHSIVTLGAISSTTPLVEGTLYIVNGVADLGSDRTIRNIAIVARGEVKTGSNVRMENVVFASENKILFGSTNDFGNVGVCQSGRYSVHAFSMQNIEFGSQSRLRGLFLVSRDMIKLGSNMLAAEGIYAEAINNIEYGSNETFVGCPNGLQSPFVPGSEVQIALMQ
jgi:Flp pilus assembly protein TadG